MYKRVGVVVLVGVLMLVGCGDEMEVYYVGYGMQVVMIMSVQEVGGNCFYSKSYDLGDGYIVIYLKMGQNGCFFEIGVKMDEQVLNNLFLYVNFSSYCVDINGNGQIEFEIECVLGYDFVMFFFVEMLVFVKLFIKYVMVNYNLFGYGLVKIYDVVYFDLYFYVQFDEDWCNICFGLCVEVINCEDFKIVQILLFVGYVFVGFVDVGVVMGMMGNYFVDLNGEEFYGKFFSYIWIWGIYGGKIIFFELMIINSYFKFQFYNQCFIYVMFQKFFEVGYYFQKYCVDFNKGLNEYIVLFENFKYFGS